MVCYIDEPICNYVTMGATFDNIEITANGASAAISQYLITKEGNTAQSVTFKNVAIDGTIGSSTTTTPVAGGVFAYVENKTTQPIVLELSADATAIDMKAKVYGAYAGGIVGVVNSEDTSTGEVQIINKKSAVTGTITGQGNAAGGIVGYLGKNATFTMDTATFSATIAGNGNNGGIIGQMEESTFTTTTAMTVKTNVSSGNSQAAGGLIGRTDNAVSVVVENVTLDGTKVSATLMTNMNTKAGGIVGLWNDTNGTARISAKDASFKNITLQGSTSVEGYDKGSIFGSVVGNKLSIETVTVDNTTVIGSSNKGLAGGIIGRVRGREVEIKDCIVSALRICAQDLRGGIIGGIEGEAESQDASYDTKVKITNVTVTTDFSQGSVTATSSGGIVGRAQRGSMLALCGEINLQVSNYGSATNKGYIVGEYDSALIYFDDSTVREYYEENRTKVTGLYDNIATYGGVLENTNGLISYQDVTDRGTNVTGTVAGSGTQADPYKITCKEDMMRLAIVLNTDGAFGTECFNVATGHTGAIALRSAHYEITDSIDLTNTGIYDLSRNDKAAETNITNHAFMGSFVGSNTDIAITMDSHETNQANIGLFPMVRNATFKNLTIKTAQNEDGTDRPWSYAKHAAGITPYVYGGLTLENIVSEVHLIARQEAAKYYYGAIAGKILLNQAYGATITSNNLTLKATIDYIRALQYTGGLAGEIQAPQEAAKANITLSGTTTVSNKFSYTGEYKVGNISYTSYSGGLIGELASSSGILKTTLVTLNAENIVVENQIMDYSTYNVVNMYNATSTTDNSIGMGGLLGHYWDNVEVDFEKITVKGEDTALLGPSTRARYGGLIGRATGKVYFHSVDLEAGTFTNGINGSGLLVSHGRFLLCMLDEYVIDKGQEGDVTVTGGAGTFDEIVGYSVFSNTEGGIVSIKDEGFKNMTSSGYKNQLSTTGKNGNTRYYYNLFEQSLTEYFEGMIEDNTLDSPAEVMVWHVNQYSTTEIKRFFYKYYASTSSNARGTAKKFKGDAVKNQLDMSGYSIYPSSLYGGVILEGLDDVTIIFNGDKVTELATADDNRLPGSSLTQHYMMHAGLLYNPNGTTVKNMNFSGSITNVGSLSGVVACNSSGSLYLENITLNNLHVTDYNGTSHKIGLLISSVNNGSNVKLTDIEMTGYSEDVYGEGAGLNTYAASALIGNVGNTSDTSIKIEFSDMKIPYVRVREDATNAPVKTESPLRYATFIDTYAYTSNTDNYTGKGIYRFTQDEYNNNTATLGKEIHYGLKYDDNDISLPDAVLTESESEYLPYVCDVCSLSTIQVNPKRGDLIEGCGIYEDPYVLNSAKQVLQLYLYLSPKSTNSDTYLSDWVVNELGVHDTHNPITYDPNDTENGFPTRDELRTAYYVVTADIDLSSVADVADYVIANDFEGIGSLSYPFAGVIYGKDGHQYTITLPGHDKGKVKTNYGFINVMKGAVVKDLNIETLVIADADAAANTKKDEIYVSTYAGGVAARIIGGDNIIDNVSIDVSYIDSNNASTKTITMGGYVGLIDKGGLIIRNMEKADVENFNPIKGTADIKDYTSVSNVVGRVWDGYLIYEGNVNGVLNETDKILTATDFGFDDDSFELSKTFQMVNGNYLDAQTAGSKITISLDDDEKTQTVSLSNAAQLEILALALNADALSSRTVTDTTSSNTIKNGYDELAICRKADYTQMGASGSEDWSLATGYDDATYNFPYLIYKYFAVDGAADIKDGYEDLYITTSAGVVASKLNKLLDTRDYTTTYVLTNGTYDMSDYQYAFRGLGELYNIYYSRFNANFDGNGSTIIADMNTGYDASIIVTALFNDLNSSKYCLDYDETEAAETQTLSIRNLVVEGKYKNAHSNSTSRVGGIAGSVLGNWTFENITIQGATLESSLQAGGIVGKLMNNTTYSTYNASNPHYRYQFLNCKVLKKTDGATTTRTTITGTAGSVGGLIGCVSSGNANDYWHGGIIECRGIQIDGMDVTSAQGSAGGFIGLVANSIKSDVIIDEYTIDENGDDIIDETNDTIIKNTVTDANIYVSSTNGKAAGGVIGCYMPVPLTGYVVSGGHNLEVKNTTVSDSVISSNSTQATYGVGGLVGLINPRAANATNTTFTFEKDTVCDVTLGEWSTTSGTTTTTTTTSQSVGGMVGVAIGETISFTDCVVKNTQGSNAKFISKGTDIGGFAGNVQCVYCTISATHSEDLMDETEVTGGVTAAAENLNIEGLNVNRVGGLLGSTSTANKSLIITGIKVKDCSIKTTGVYDSENPTKCGAGGLVGIIATVNNTDTSQTEVQYNNILVTGCDIEGYATGGLTGVSRTADAKCYNVIAQNIAVRQNNLLGQGAGGVFGLDLATGTERTNNYKNILVDSNKIAALQKNTGYSYIWAGGFSGKVNNSGLSGSLASATQYYNDVVISNNYIVGYSKFNINARIGGMFGLISTGAQNKNSYIYNPVIENNYIGIWNEQSTDLSVYTMDVLKSIGTDKVGLLEYNTSSATYTVVDSLPDTMTEDEIQYYAANVGSIAGKMVTTEVTKEEDKDKTFRVVVLKPEITFDSSAIRPVVDCGEAFSEVNKGVSIDGNYSIEDSTYPYSYRSQFNVIYFDTQGTVSTGSVQSDIISKVNAATGTIGSSETLENEYLLDSIETIASAYAAVDNTEADTQQLLNAYRLNQYYTAPDETTQLTIMDIYNKAYYDGSNDAAVVSKMGIPEDLADIPLIVYDAQNGTASEVIYSIIKMLTNGGDTLNSVLTTNSTVKMTAKRATVDNGVITIDTTSGQKPSLTVSGRNINYDHYDTYDEENDTTSITLLEISYYWTTGLGEKVRETYYLPVYVLERLDVWSFIRIKEGAVYSYDEMQSSTIGDGTDSLSVVMANDTTYTMAIEFLYGSGRAKFGTETVNKVIEMQKTTASGTFPRTFAAGTQLTLIDVETGYAYYYKVTKTDATLVEQGVLDGISFEKFAQIPGDADTAYTARTMKEVNSINSAELQASYTALSTDVYTNVGVERYLLIVDGSEAEVENATYDLTVVADKSQDNNSKDIYDAAVIDVTSIPGLEVGFKGPDTLTKITGQMMRDEDVVIDAVFGITAPKDADQSESEKAPYWLMASDGKVIDSINNGKYLELAFYLQDKSGNRITLPQNTSISIKIVEKGEDGDEVKVDSLMTASGSQSVFYCYKDSVTSESLSGISDDKEWVAQITLSFDTAILDSYNDEYSVMIELLRTDDPEYPMSGDKPDFYADDITAHIETDLAVAIKADDLITLGINTYMEETHNYEIPCTAMIDFGSVIEFDLEDVDNGNEVVNKQLKKWCDETEYQVTYRLYKKVETADGKTYVPVSDERISLWKADDLAESGYSPFETTTDENGQIIYQEYKTFDQDDVRTGTDGAKGLMTDKLLLKVDTEDIPDSDLSNYKLEMSVIAFDRGTTTDGDGNQVPLRPTGNEAVLQDFFIFTISKLKTDME